MNQKLWHQHLIRTNHALTLEVKRLRAAVTYQRKRADLWKHRALTVRQPRKSLASGLSLAEHPDASSNTREVARDRTPLWRPGP